MFRTKPMPRRCHSVEDRGGPVVASTKVAEFRFHRNLRRGGVGLPRDML